MGFGSLLRKGLKVASAVNKSPLGNFARMVPGVGTVLGAAGVASSIYGVAKGAQSMLGGGGGGGMPALPSGGLGGMPVTGGAGYGLPALPGSANAPAIVGKRSVFRDDPNIANALKAWAISQRFLKTAVRSPIKGYVIVRDAVGDPYALPRSMAIKYAGYRPAKKPPISVGEYQALKKADRTVSKVRKIMTMVARVDKAVGKGGKVRIRAPKKGGR